MCRGSRHILTGSCHRGKFVHGAGASSPSKPRLSRFAEYALFTAALKLNNLGWHEVPLAVEHPRGTENPPRTPSGRRPRLGTIQPPVERLFPPFGGSLTREREGRGRNFSFTVLRLFFWLQKKRGKLRRGDGSAERYCGAVNQSKRFPLSRIQPLSQLR